MAMLKATKRSEKGTRKARRLREAGDIPGIVYGHGKEPLPITINEHDMEMMIQHGERVLELDLGDLDETVLIKDVQWDTFGQEVLHVDFARVNLDERVEVTVSVELSGTPEGVREGGVLQQPVTEVNIEVPVRNIPEELSLHVSDMKLWDRKLLSELELPKGAVLLDDPEEVLCNCIEIQEELPEEEGEEESLGAEPEVIGEKKEEESGEESAE